MSDTNKYFLEYEYEYENEICKKPHFEQPRPPTVVSDPAGENSTDPAQPPFHGGVQPGGIA